MHYAYRFGHQVTSIWRRRKNDIKKSNEFKVNKEFQSFMCDNEKNQLFQIDWQTP